MGVHSEFFLIDTATAPCAPADRRRALYSSRLDDRAAGRPRGVSARRANTVRRRVDDPAARPASPTRVTWLFDRLDREFAVPRQEKTTWKGADGTPIEGVSLYPTGYSQGRVSARGAASRRPDRDRKFGVGAGLVLNYVPVLAAKGYAVLRPNYRGSTGYGAAFARDVVDGYFTTCVGRAGRGRSSGRTGVADPDADHHGQQRRRRRSSTSSSL